MIFTYTLNEGKHIGGHIDISSANPCLGTIMQTFNVGIVWYLDGLELSGVEENMDEHFTNNPTDWKFIDEGSQYPTTWSIFNSNAPKYHPVAC